MPSGSGARTKATGGGTHFLFSCIPAWGHAKPFSVLAARLVKEKRDAMVTMLLAPNILGRAEVEVAAALRAHGVDEDEDVRTRLRILSTFKSDAPDLFGLLGPLAESYRGAYEELWNARSISCATTGRVFSAVPRPDVVVLDFFAHPQMLATRAVSGASVPIIAWVTGHIAHILHIFGPARLGGSDVDFPSRIRAEMERTGRSALEVGDNVYMRTEGAKVEVPGALALYDWEFFPQTLPFTAPEWVEIVIAADAGLKECDAVFSTSADAFEEVSLRAFVSWMAEQKKAVNVFGPLLSAEQVETEAEEETDGEESPSNNVKTKDFLQNALEKYGEKSVLLISFGTIFWPTNQSYIDEVIEALIENEFPFIVTHASPFAKISDDLVQRVSDTDLGLILEWVPQQYILNHPATGWFMTHGGQNSVYESLGSGVPMICWPFEADQPIAAAHLSENLKVAFELLEVRTGAHGTKPLLRNARAAQGTRAAVGAEIRQVLATCRGPHGEELRRNARALQAAFAEAWGEEGASRGSLGLFWSLKEKGVEAADPEVGGDTGRPAAPC